ncbi:MAG TPA: Gfo/Idh/MocA family oxidoreductase, partial [Burkholderiales bacterium]
YVRWTANRNMQAFLDLLAQGKLDVPRLITHRFPFSEAVSVFDKVSTGELAHAVGLVFEYPEPEKGVFGIQPRTLMFGGDRPRGKLRLGQIGAGNYAKSMLMPCFSSLENLSLEGICTTRGANAEALARRYGFRKATTDAWQLLRDPEINAIMVATRHDSHAQYAAAALEAGRHVYVEKPLAMSEDEIEPIITALATRGKDAPTLWIGYNRRFSLLSQRANDHMKDVGLRQVTCIVRSAGVPADSWYQDELEGGGILFGDVCHYIDLAVHFVQSLPVEVSAFATSDNGHREEGWAITIRFVNGSLGVVHYTCGSQQGLKGEAIEILGGGRSAQITGFRRLVLHGGPGGGVRLFQPDRGQKAMLQAMAAQFSGTPGATDYTESFLVSAQTLLAVKRSIAERRIVSIEPRFPFRIG